MIGDGEYAGKIGALLLRSCDFRLPAHPAGTLGCIHDAVVTAIAPAARRQTCVRLSRRSNQGSHGHQAEDHKQQDGQDFPQRSNWTANGAFLQERPVRGARSCIQVLARRLEPPTIKSHPSLVRRFCPRAVGEGGCFTAYWSHTTRFDLHGKSRSRRP